MIEAAPAAKSAAAIEARDFSLWYSERQALFDISLEFAPLRPLDPTLTWDRNTPRERPRW